MKKFKLSVAPERQGLVYDIITMNPEIGGKLRRLTIKGGVSYFDCSVANAEKFKRAVTDFCLTIEEQK